jgi:hypothetical protein
MASSNPSVMMAFLDRGDDHAFSMAKAAMDRYKDSHGWACVRAVKAKMHAVGRLAGLDLAERSP